jgi:hypothetical protein
LWLVLIKYEKIEAKLFVHIHPLRNLTCLCIVHHFQTLIDRNPKFSKNETFSHHPNM